MVRVILAGPELEGFSVGAPAASVRLLLPAPTRSLELPRWNGNEFLQSDGSRPQIRTFTPLRVDSAAFEVDLEILLHGDGVAARWARAVGPGDLAALSGPGRGYSLDPEAGAFLLAGDETAIPAIGQLLEAIPTATAVHVHIEQAGPPIPPVRWALPSHPGATIEWWDLPDGAAPGESLLAAVRRATIPGDARVWVAGEAAGVQRVRRHLFEDRGLLRSQATVRGYWKHGRSGDVGSSEE